MPVQGCEPSNATLSYFFMNSQKSGFSCENFIFNLWLREKLANQTLFGIANITHLEFQQDPARLSLLFTWYWLRELEAWNNSLTFTSLEVDVDCQLGHQLGSGTQHLHPTTSCDCLASLCCDGFPIKLSQWREEKDRLNVYCLLSFCLGRQAMALLPHSIHQKAWLELAHIQGKRY